MNTASVFGITALVLAETQGHPEVARVLEAAGD